MPPRKKAEAAPAAPQQEDNSLEAVAHEVLSEDAGRRSSTAALGHDDGGDDDDGGDGSLSGRAPARAARSTTGDDDDFRARYEREKTEWDSHRSRYDQDLADLRYQIGVLTGRTAQPQPQAPQEPQYQPLPNVFDKPEEYIAGYVGQVLDQYERHRSQQRGDRDNRSLNSRITRSERLMSKLDEADYTRYQQAQRDPTFRAYLDANPGVRQGIVYDPMPAYAIVEEYDAWQRQDPGFVDTERERLRAEILAEYGIDPAQRGPAGGGVPASKIRPGVQAPRGTIATIRSRAPQGGAVETDPLFMTAEQRRKVEQKYLHRNLG